MGTLSMTASDWHTKDHWPPVRCSDLLGDECSVRTAEFGNEANTSIEDP